MTCDLCSHHPHEPGAEHTERCKEREANAGKCCAVCRQKLRDMLDSVLLSLEMVSVVSWDTRSGDGRSSEPTLPGGTDRLSWLDSVPRVMNSWCRDWIETLDQPEPSTGDIMTVIGWLRRHLDQACAEHEALDEFADELHTLDRTGRRLAGEVQSGQRVTCPTDDCERVLRVDVHDLDTETVCKDCGTRWTVAWLLLVAAHSDGWVDEETAVRATGVPRSTMARWAKAGKVQRDKGMYYLASIRTAKATKGKAS